jgi:hypothetical protein
MVSVTGCPKRNLSSCSRVPEIVENTKQYFDGPKWQILVDGCFFIVVLGFSAVWEADIRWLHFFQAWMYIAAIMLGLRGNRWGYFIGISDACGTTPIFLRLPSSSMDCNRCLNRLTPGIWRGRIYLSRCLLGFQICLLL